jgi:integrase
MISGATMIFIWLQLSYCFVFPDIRVLIDSIPIAAKPSSKKRRRLVPVACLGGTVTALGGVSLFVRAVSPPFVRSQRNKGWRAFAHGEVLTLSLNRAVVLRYRLQLEAKKLAASTINVRLAAVRRLAYQATDTGLLSPELVAGIRRVEGVPQLGRRVGNWLSVAEGKELLLGTTAETLRQKRDAAIISFLLGCGLRRSEVVALAFGDIQKREDHWAIVDLVGKAGHVRTAPVPAWVKTAVDEMDQERPYRQWQAVPLNSKKRNRLGRRNRPECRLVRSQRVRGASWN